MENYLNYPSLKNLRVGDHLCCLYKTEEEHREVITPFIRYGLKNGEKVIYIVDIHTANTVLGYLKEDGLDIKLYLGKGQLDILTSKEAYIQDNLFDPDKMINLLKSLTEMAVTEGYTALRVTGEMTWALRKLPGSERLIEYESKLNYFLPNSRCLAICQYNIEKFTSAILLDVLTTHPFVVLGAEVFSNFYYIPPDDFLEKERASIYLKYWQENLIERKLIDISLRRERDQSKFYQNLLSHDINNILQIILNITEQSLHYLDNPKNIGYFKEIYKKIIQQIDKGAELIKIINKLSQLKESIIPIHPIEIYKILDKEIKLVKQSTTTKKIAIQIQTPKSKLYVQANEILSEVFDNILHNSIKFNHNVVCEIIIRISEELKDKIEYLKIEFIDNGIGIPNDKKELIFQKGYKIDKDTAGTGFGLFLTENIISYFKGKIWVENRIKGDHSKGSNFIVLIPKASI
ncbi:MAG: MEDS domain-containing protein [Promethearchaeota archaeon]